MSSMQHKASLAAAWRFVADFARYSGRKGAVAAVFVGLGAVAEGVSVLLLIPLLAVLTRHNEGSGWVADTVRRILEPLSDFPTSVTLGLLLAAFGGIMLIRSAVIMARDVRLAELNFGYVQALRLGLARRLAATDWGTVSRLSHARVVRLMTNDVQRSAGAVQFSLQASVALIGVVVQVTLAFLLSPPLAVFSLLMLAVAAIVTGPLVRRARQAGEGLSAAHHALIRDTNQFLGGLKQAFAYNRETAFVSQIEIAAGALHDTYVDFSRQQAASRVATAVAAAAIGGAALWIGYVVLGLAAPVLMALLFILARLGGPLAVIQQGLIQLANSLPAYEEILALNRELEAGSRAAAPTTSTPPPPLDGPIVFEDVGFLHTGAEDSTRGVSGLTLAISPGEHIGIAGPSGAGKTTFADLLSGLYSPRTGRISVAGQTLDGQAARAWRERVAYVPQDPFLFHDTVRANLLWGAPAVDEQAIWEALAQTGADQLVSRMEAGLDTVVGERGTLVSGGERQRLALSRAILRKPDLLILDEATSALDPQSEATVLKRLRAAFPDATLVMIAHRLESLADCERRLVFEGGRLLSDSASRRAGAA